MAAPDAVARVAPGIDCTTIAPSVFAPDRTARPFDAQAWMRVIGPGCVKEAHLDWFAPPRSMVEALRLAYGDTWRIDLLPAGEDMSGLFLLTQRRTGWRLMVRLGVGLMLSADPMSIPPAPRPLSYVGSPVGQWCSDPQEPRGDDLRETARYATSTAVRRRGWLARALRDNSVATEDLHSMLRSVGIRPERPSTVDDGLGYARLLSGALVEVWLAENGYTGSDAQSIRALVALRGLDTLRVYERAALTARDGGHR